jgi:hypothetical protein
MYVYILLITKLVSNLILMYKIYSIENHLVFVCIAHAVSGTHAMTETIAP